MIVSGGHNTVDSGIAAGGALLDAPDRPTAIVGLSDVVALGVLQAMHERGLRAPGDVSVSGFDDIAAAAEAGLTTVRQPILEKGRRVGELLLDAELEPRQVLLPIELVVRDSTGDPQSPRPRRVDRAESGQGALRSSAAASHSSLSRASSSRSSSR